MSSAARIFGNARFAGVSHMPGRAKPAPANPYRRQLLAKVHLAKKELGLSDDDYRAILLEVAAVDSAGKASDAQLVAIVERFKARGWKQAAPKGRSGTKPADHKPATKARAMWISLYHLGAIANPSEQALEAFGKRQLGVDRLQWANQGLMYRLIEALKAIAERNGWSQALEGVRPEAAPIVLRRRLVEALLAKLRAAGFVGENWADTRAILEFSGMDVSMLLATSSEMDTVARELGRVLREAKGGAA